jgi:hypothetical protein
VGFYSDSEPVSEPSFWVENELDVPLIPAALLDQHEKFHSTHLGTLREPNPESDYMFRPSLKFLSRSVPDHYVLSFWGHGAQTQLTDHEVSCSQPGHCHRDNSKGTACPIRILAVPGLESCRCHSR